MVFPRKVSSSKVRLVVVDNEDNSDSISYLKSKKKTCISFGETGTIMVLSLIAIQIAIILYLVAKNQNVKFEKGLKAMRRTPSKYMHRISAKEQPFLTIRSSKVASQASLSKYTNVLRTNCEVFGRDQETREYDLTRELHLLDKFEEFIRKYDKVYDSKEEFAERFRIYVNNMVEAQQLTQRNRDHRTIYGENEFADWTVEEFQEILLPKDFFKNLRDRATFIDSLIHLPEPVMARREEIPDHFDWRPYNVVTPVKSQFKCGSCWAFATVGTVESACALGTGELRSLSEQQLLDCNLENNACDGGDVDKALRYVYDEGLMREYDYPYVAHRQDTCQLRGETAHIKAAVFLHQDEASIIDWLLHYGPVNVGINVTADMKAYKGGVYTPDQWECENKIIGTHSINIVGYGTWKATNQKYWIVKNSWGQSYGIEDGYVYFARGINSCGIEDEPVGVLA